MLFFLLSSLINRHSPLPFSPPAANVILSRAPFSLTPPLFRRAHRGTAQRRRRRRQFHLLPCAAFHWHGAHRGQRHQHRRPFSRHRRQHRRLPQRLHSRSAPPAPAAASHRHRWRIPGRAHPAQHAAIHFPAPDSLAAPRRNFALSRRPAHQLLGTPPRRGRQNVPPAHRRRIFPRAAYFDLHRLFRRRRRHPGALAARPAGHGRYSRDERSKSAAGQRSERRCHDHLHLRQNHFLAPSPPHDRSQPNRRLRRRPLRPKNEPPTRPLDSSSRRRSHVRLLLRPLLTRR